MAWTDSGTAQKLARQCEALIALRAKQDELRAAIRAAIADKTTSMPDVAKAGGTNRGRIDKFLSRETGIYSGTLLHGVCKHVGKEQVAKDVESLVEGMSERMCAVSNFEEPTIRLLFTMLSHHGRLSEEISGTIQEYANSFDEAHRDIVQRSMRFSGEALAKLIETVQDVPVTLTGDEAEAHYERAKASALKARAAHNPRRQHLRGLMDELGRLYGEFQLAYEAMAIPINAVPAALRGDASEAQVEYIIGKAEMLLAMKQAASEQPTAEHAPSPIPSNGTEASVQASAQASVAPPTSLEEILNTVAGETSELGVDWTLSPNSFRQLNLMLAGEIVEPARQIVRLARAYLNIITQADNPDLRAGIQKTLGPEVDELYLAIQLFVTKIPSELTGLIEEQRRLFKGGKATKKKAGAS